MGKYSRLQAIKDWLAHLPMRAAYRIVWLMALTGNRDARDVYRAMWAAGLDLPRIAELATGAPDDL